MIAHRGASGYRRENTLPAFELAVEQRADMIEIDLHLTRDGAVVVVHDSRHPGLPGSGEIAGAALDEVRALDLGGGDRIPTLDEVLDGFGARIPFNLELKSRGGAEYAGLEAAALEAVTRRGLLDRTLFSCFSHRVLEVLRGLEPAARLALLVEPAGSDGAIERALAVGTEALNPWRGIAEEDLIGRAHDAGLAVYVFTVDAPEEMRRLLDRGADGLFTNYPDRLRALLDPAG